MLLSRECLQAGYNAEIEWRYEAALVWYTNAIILETDMLIAWNAKCRILIKLGLLEEALQTVEQALQVVEQVFILTHQNSDHLDFTNALLLKALIFAQLERFEDAISLYNQVIILKPTMALAWASSGKMLLMAGYRVIAEEFIDQALAIDPHLSYALLAKGEIWRNKKCFDEATLCYDAVLNHHDEDYIALHEIGSMRLHRNKHYEINKYLRPSSIIRHISDENNAYSLDFNLGNPPNHYACITTIMTTNADKSVTFKYAFKDNQNRCARLLPLGDKGPLSDEMGLFGNMLIDWAIIQIKFYAYYVEELNNKAVNIVMSALPGYCKAALSACMDYMRLTEYVTLFDYVGSDDANESQNMMFTNLMMNKNEAKHERYALSFVAKALHIYVQIQKYKRASKEREETINRAETCISQGNLIIQQGGHSGPYGTPAECFAKAWNALALYELNHHCYHAAIRMAEYAHQLLVYGHRSEKQNRAVAYAAAQYTIQEAQRRLSHVAVDSKRMLAQAIILLPMPASLASLPSISPVDIVLQGKLGEGAFASVYQGIWANITVAVKRFNMDGKWRTKKEDVGHEAHMMAGLHHPNVVRFLGASRFPGCDHIVMEYCMLGSLAHWLRVWPYMNAINLTMMLQIALDVANGLAYLHHQEVIHCDIKTENVLLGAAMEAKISDFGLSKYKSEIKREWTVAGTLPILAPEVLLASATHSEKSDMFSYGWVLWELCVRKKPYHPRTEREVRKLVAANVQEPIPAEPLKLATLIRSCWQAPQLRPTAEQAIHFLSNTAVTS